MESVELKSVYDIYKKKKYIKEMFKYSDINFFINLKFNMLSDIKYGFYILLAGQYIFHLKELEAFSNK